MDWKKPLAPHRTAMTGMECWKEMMMFRIAEAATPTIMYFL